MMAKRTDSPKDLKVVDGTTPNFLAQYVEKDTSLDNMDQYVIIPMLKTIQGLSDQSLKDRFGEGAVVVRPGDVLVAEREESFIFQPLFFFTEFCKWADRRDKSQNSIVVRTFDETSEVAKLSRDPEKRQEVYSGHEQKKPDDQWKYRYVEHLNFPGVIRGDHELTGTFTTLSFQRGEFTQGKNFISAVKMRRQELQEGQRVKVPLWAQVWAFKSTLRDRNGNKWFGLDFVAADPSVIGESMAQDSKARFDDLKNSHEKKLILVDRGEEDVETSSTEM